MSSVESKGLSALIPKATQWTCSSSRMSQGTAGAGSCATPVKVRLSGAPHGPERGQDEQTYSEVDVRSFDLNHSDLIFRAASFRKSTLNFQG